MDEFIEELTHPTPTHEVIARTLREQIVLHQLPPGAPLREKELAALHGVSREMLRNALKVLAVEGLVEFQPRRGALVTRLERQRLRDTLETIGALERLAGELACANASQDEISTLRHYHDMMARHYRKQDAAGFFRYSQHFHQGIVDAAGNDVLTRIYRLLNGQAARARYLAHMTAQAWDEVMTEQDEIMLALEARAADRLAELLEDSLLHRAQRVLELINQAAE
ncbi:MAG: GntR family transcriptional regulator [Casimicrobium sp.]